MESCQRDRDKPTSDGQRVNHWLIEKLSPYDGNPRTHSDAQIAQIAVSIAGLGVKTRVWSIPRPASSQSRGRMLAARKLLLKDVPVTGRKSRY